MTKVLEIGLLWHHKGHWFLTDTHWSSLREILRQHFEQEALNRGLNVSLSEEQLLCTAAALNPGWATIRCVAPSKTPVDLQKWKTSKKIKENLNMEFFMFLFILFTYYIFYMCNISKNTLKSRYCEPSSSSPSVHCTKLFRLLSPLGVNCHHCRHRGAKKKREKKEKSFYNSGQETHCRLCRLSEPIITIISAEWAQYHRRPPASSLTRLN